MIIKTEVGCDGDDPMIKRITKPRYKKTASNTFRSPIRDPSNFRKIKKNNRSVKRITPQIESILLTINP